MRHIKDVIKKFYQFIAYLQSREKLSAALFYLVLICIFYSPVVFFGKTLQPPLYYPNSITEKGVWEYEGRKPTNNFNVEFGTTTYGDWPYNKFIGDSYKQGRFPLWNPYQGLGVAVPEQYGHKVFFPYQILEDISPPIMWDLFILGRLFIAGFFTFLFLRLLGLSKISSLLGGVLYMFSGSMVWFINFEQFVNPAMMAPILLWGFEKLIRKQRLKNIAIAGIILGLTLLSGTPGVILYILLLAITYFWFRTITIKRKIFSKNLLKLFPVLILGLMLAAPQILPFLNFLPDSFNHRISESDFSIAKAPWLSSILIILPGLSESPTFYRIWAANGLWDNLGGYAGILPILLIILGLVIGFFKKDWQLKFILFFGGFGFSVLLKNFGIPPFIWLGKLPFFNIVWSPRWAGPSWNISLAIAGALGFEIIKRNWINFKFLETLKNTSKKLLLGLIISLSVMIIVFIIEFILKSEELGIASFWENKLTWFTGIIILSIAILLIRRYIKRGIGLSAIMGLALLELWFWIPRGYDSSEMLMKLIPFFLGFIVVWALINNKWRWVIIGAIVFFVSFSLTDLKSPDGFPKRHDPFTKAPYIDFLKEKQKENGYFRIIGGDGVLMPNYASAFGINDLRYIDGVPLATFVDFRINNLHKFIPVKMGLQMDWLTGMPEFMADEEMYPWNKFQKIKKSRLIKSAGGGGEVMNIRLEEDIRTKLPFYSLLGVKYILMPASIDINKPYGIKKGDESYFPLVYDKEIKIYENPYALPRAFLAHNAEYVSSWREAQRKTKEFIKNETDGLGLKNTVMLEEKLPEDSEKTTSAENAEEKIEIIKYQPNKIIINAAAKSPGVLVLTDAFYSPWSAEIDGKSAKIYRIDGLLRGVYLKEGNHTIIFKYFPRSFTEGLLMIIIALIACLILIVFSKKQIKQIILILIIFPLTGFGFYFYAEKFMNIKSSFIPKIESGQKKSDLELNREKIMKHIIEKINTLNPYKKSDANEDLEITKFLFTKDSYKNVYVEYKDETNIKKLILIQVSEQNKDAEDGIIKLSKYLMETYFEPVKTKNGWSWKFKDGVQNEAEKTIEVYLKDMKILTTLADPNEKKDLTDLTVYAVMAYFEQKGNIWALKAGEKTIEDKELDFYDIDL